MRRPIPAAALLALACPAAGFAGDPPGYYDTVDATNPAALRLTLHVVIDDHQRFPYTSGSSDTWDILELAQEDPADPGRIVDVYRNASLAKVGGGNPDYNREHTWPNSYGFPDDGPGNYPYTDCHQLHLCDVGYNSARENKPFGGCSASCAEYPTLATGGQGGGSGTYPGNSNWTSGTSTSGRWETWIGRRGDVARALFYLDVRYEGGTHGVTGHWEPDLVLTDDLALIAASATGQNETLAYMGLRSTLLQWHVEDPVDELERRRNDAVYSFQGNRNPFVDHPEWVACLFEGACGGPGAIELYCFGTGCPCGNDDPGAGCRNSTGTGALLAQSSGGTSAGLDDLVITASGVPASQFGLLFMGKGRLALPFGDGLLCVGAGGVGLFRFPVQGSGPAGRLEEGPGIVALSQARFPAAGGIDPGDTWHFQAWFRDPPGPCGSAFNLSNGLSVTFAP